MPNVKLNASGNIDQQLAADDPANTPPPSELQASQPSLDIQVEIVPEPVFELTPFKVVTGSDAREFGFVADLEAKLNALAARGYSVKGVGQSHNTLVVILEL